MQEAISAVANLACSWRGWQKDGRRFALFFSITTLVGAFVSFVPILLPLRPQSSTAWSTSSNDDAGSDINNNSYYFDDQRGHLLTENETQHAALIRDFAMINIGLIVPSVVNALLDKAHDIRSCGDSVLSVLRGGRSGSGHDDSKTKSSAGLTAVELIKLLLGIAVSSLFAFLVPSETFDMRLKKFSHHSQDYAAVVFMSTICCTVVLFGSTLTFSLRRLCGGIRRSSWNGPRSLLILVTLIAGALCFSWGTYEEVLHKYSSSSPQKPAKRNIFLAGATLWYVSLAVFVYCALRWAREAFRLARLSPTLDSGSTSSKKSSHLNFYVPMMLIFTHIFAMAVVLSVIVPFTLTNQSASLQVNLEQLQSYFIGMSIVTVLVVVLELRLKTFEINEGLAALESKRSFVRYISHEVRTPLNTVCLGLELLSDELNNSRTDSEEVNGYRDCVDQIREAAGIAVEILNDLLQYDKMQDNALQIQKSPHRAIEMVNEIFNTFKIQARKGGVSFVPEFLNPAPMPNSNGQLDEMYTRMLFAQALIRVDKAKIAQVIRNFMSNALKFTPPGGVVTVSVRFSDELGPADRGQLSGEETKQGFRGGGGGQHTSAGSSGGGPYGSLSRLGSSLRGILAAGSSSSKKGGFSIQPQPPAAAGVHVHANITGGGSKDNPQEDGGDRSRSGSTPSGGSSPRAALGTNGDDDYGVKLMAFMPFVHRGGAERHDGAKRLLSASNLLLRRRKGSARGPTRNRRPKYLILEVTDTGVGIEKENVGRVFNEIVQFNPNELQGGGGSGLGLFLSRGIVAAHKGKVWLTSEGLGKGCTFGFGLPVRFDDDARSRRIINNLMDLFGPSKQGGGKIAPVNGPQAGRVVSAAGDRDTGRMTMAGGDPLPRRGRRVVAPTVDGSIIGGGSIVRSGTSRHGEEEEESRQQRRQEVGGGGGFVLSPGRKLRAAFGKVLRGAPPSEASSIAGDGLNVLHSGCTVSANDGDVTLPPANMLLPPRRTSMRQSFSVAPSSLLQTAEGGRLMQKLYYTASAAAGGGGRRSSSTRIIDHVANHSSGVAAVNMMNLSLPAVAADGHDDEPVEVLMIARRSSANSMGAYGDLLDGECKLSPEEEEQQQLPYRHSASERELPIGGGFGRSLSPTNFRPSNPVAVVLADMEPSILRIHSYDTPPVAVNQHRSNVNSTGGRASGKKEAATDIIVVKKYHVLVVDDSSLNRRMLCKALASINCTTEEAEDGLQAVEMVERSLVMACCSEQPQLDVQLEENRKPGATPVPPSLGAQPRGRSIKDVVNRKKKEAADGIGSQLKMLALPFSSVGLTGAAAAAASKEKRRLPALIVEENSRDLLSTSDHKSLSKKPSAGGLISRPKSSDFLSSEHERDARMSSMEVNSVRERSGRLSFPIANSEKISQHSQDSQAVSAIEQSIAIARRSLKELPAVIEDESPQAATPTIADLEAGEHSSATSHASSTHRIRQFDFILCDNVMPVMDGPTAVKKMRELGYTAPVFGVTGNVLPSDVELFIAHGATSVLSKPLKLALLKAAIKEYLPDDWERMGHLK